MFEFLNAFPAWMLNHINIPAAFASIPQPPTPPPVATVLMHCNDCHVRWRSIIGEHCWVCGKEGHR